MKTGVDRDKESQRIISRVGAETEASMAQRTVRRARDHMAGTDADQDDWAEVWGTRIGRGVGLIMLVVLTVIVASYFLR